MYAAGHIRPHNTKLVAIHQLLDAFVIRKKDTGNIQIAIVGGCRSGSTTQLRVTERWHTRRKAPLRSTGNWLPGDGRPACG